jgi:hypothetical protein
MVGSSPHPGRSLHGRADGFAQTTKTLMKVPLDGGHVSKCGQSVDLDSRIEVHHLADVTEGLVQAINDAVSDPHLAPKGWK